MGDYELPDVNVRVCGLRIHKSAIHPTGLPCLKNNPQMSEFSPTSSGRYYNDSAVLEPGHVCPVHGRGIEGSNTFKISAVYQLMDGVFNPDDPYVLGLGIYTVNSSIYVSTKTYLLQPAPTTLLPISSMNGGPTEPFITTSPLITTQEYIIGESFTVDFIIKTQPMSQGTYVIKLIGSEYIKVCGTKVVHVGGNMPCTSNSADEHKGIDLEIPQTKVCGLGDSTNITLSHVTNWGNQELKKDSISDDDTIRIRSILSVCEGAENFELFKYIVEYNEQSLEYFYNITLGSESNGAVDLSDDLTPELVYGFDEGTTIYANTPKIIEMKYSIPEEFVGAGSLTVKVRNAGYGTSAAQANLCSAHVVTVGENFPCFDSSRLVTSLSEQSSLDEFGNPYYEYLEFTLKFCRFDLSKEAEQNQV